MAKSRFGSIIGGIGGGVGAGVMVSALSLGALSLMAPPPAGAPDPRDPARSSPETALVPLPDSSEFGKGPSDPVLQLPMVDPLPSGDGPALGTAPVPDAQPSFASDPASRPEAVEAPTTPDTPQSETAALKSPVEGESPIPVPPPGEAQAPGLGRPVSEGVVADPETARLEETRKPEETGKFEETGAPDALTDMPALAMPSTPQPSMPLASGDAPEMTAPDAPVPAPADMPAPEQRAIDTPDLQTAETAPDMGPDTGDMASAQPSAPPAIAEAPDAGTEPPAPRPEVIVLDAPSAPAGKPATGFQNAGNVTTNRLPSIGNDASRAADRLTADAPLPAIQAYALPFTSAGSAPLYSVVLIDPGTKAGGLDPATLKTIGFPLTIAIDPNRMEAALDAATYRAAGFEVAILVSALPEGATAQDLEVAVEAWRQVIPEAVAVVEPPKPVLQTNRVLSQTLVKILAREGLGLITQAGGLNAADQLAAKEGVPHARIWRVIDDGREKAPVIERMLGRAGFEASKDGAVAVMLSAWPESLSGLLTWEPSRDKDIALAPISALALRGE